MRILGGNISAVVVIKQNEQADLDQCSKSLYKVSMARILILSVKVPFTRGGQDALVNSLCNQLKSRGHLADVLEIPYNPLPKENLLLQAAIWRSFDLNSFAGEPIDLVIATKFPSYYARHARKSLWLVHQHRAIYDLYASRFSDISDDPRDEALRRMLVEGDDLAIGECAYISAISQNVAQRLKEYNSINAETLYPPLPLGNSYINKESENYILSVGRLCGIKRVDMMIKALPIVHNFVKLKIVGLADEPGIMDYYKNEIDKHHLWDRVEFLGRVSDSELIELYAKALAVYYAPFNEDYGYVTLEAFASAKPLLTCTDSGAVLEFAKHEENALVLEPSLDAIGHGANRLIEDREMAKHLGVQGRNQVEKLGLMQGSWERVIESLLSPLRKQ